MKTTMRSEAIYSDDDRHRLSLKKVWNSKQPMVTVITKFPRYEGQVKVDLTTQLIINNVYDMGFGGCYLTNLFTNIEISERMEEVEDLNHEEADEYLVQAVKNSETVILAWGSTSSKIITQRIDEVHQKLNEYVDKIRVLINPTTKQICHPLNPKSRSMWMVEPLNIRSDSKQG